MGVNRDAIGKAWWMSADFVVEESLRALQSRKLFVIPGWRYKLLVAVGSRLPVGMRLAVERMSAHRRHRTRE
jgi:short-subunit dehydrogenase